MMVSFTHKKQRIAIPASSIGLAELPKGGTRILAGPEGKDLADKKNLPFEAAKAAVSRALREGKDVDLG